MKRNFYKTRLFLIVFLLAPCFQTFAQVQEKHPDSYYANSHVTGIGSSTITYQLDAPLSAETAQACQTYLANYPRITHATLSNNAIIMQFNEQIISNEMIYLFIQRLEMNYIYKPKKS